MQPALLACGRWERPLGELALPLELDRLMPGPGAWEVELGFGKGRYLLQRAQAEPEGRFLGIEVASSYYRLARGRALKRGLGNLALMRGDALYLLSAATPAGFAGAVHLYFPDPWPKSRHHKRRMLDLESADLVLGLLRPEGVLFFATDHREYGEVAGEVLESHPGVVVKEQAGPWPGGPRTNYEAKYEAESRWILRLEVTLAERGKRALLHPQGRSGVVAAHCPREDGGE